MGIQANVKRQEAKLAAQAQAAQAEGQPHSAAPEESNVQPTFDTEALRQIIRTELHAVPQPLGGDEGALQQIVQGAVRTAWQTTPIEPQQVDMEAVRHVIRVEMQAALSVPVPVDIRMCRSAIHEELRDIHLALRLLTEAIQAQVQTGYDDDEEESDEQDDELLPTALSYATSDQDSGEPKMFPAQENEEEDRVAPGCIEPEQFVVQSPVRPESPIRRLQRPGPEIIVLKSPPRALRRWEPLA